MCVLLEILKEIVHFIRVLQQYQIKLCNTIYIIYCAVSYLFRCVCMHTCMHACVISLEGKESEMCGKFVHIASIINFANYT